MVISLIIIIVTVPIFSRRPPSVNLAQDAPGACQPASCAMVTRGSGADDCGWDTWADWTWGKDQWSWQWTDSKDQWSHNIWRYGGTASPVVEEAAGEASSAEQATAAPEAAAASATGAGHDAPDSDATHPPAPTSRALVLLPQPGEAGGAAQPACLPQGGEPGGAPQPPFFSPRTCFMTETLPRKATEFAAAVPEFRKYRTARDAMNGAYALSKHLPLRADTLTTLDLATDFGEEGAIVVAEKVSRVPDPNRGGDSRVDFFCYKANGDVVRHHPGRCAKQDMRPHRMPWGSVLFDRAAASSAGVGSALHARPPGLLGVATCTAGTVLADRAAMSELCPFDVKSVNWKLVREALRVLPSEDHTVDWSDGALFPWWVWLANTGTLRDVVNNGVRSVHLEVRNGEKSVVVRSVAGEFRLWQDARYGKLVVTPTPRKYDAY